MSYKWNGSEFYTRSGAYLDRAQTPFFNTYHSLFPIRREVLRSVPHFEHSTPAYNKVFEPFVESCGTFWQRGVARGAFNQSYAPYVVLYYVIRDHVQEFIEIVDGVVIESEDSYNRILNLFNDIFDRVLQGRGRGTIRGYCSEDEMIRIGTLFYLLQVSCDHSEGLILNDDQLFMNKWGGKLVLVDLDRAGMEQYSKKLQSVVMSDKSWSAFMNYYMSQTDSDTLWFINVPDFLNHAGRQRNINKAQDFTQRDFVSLIDYFPLITSRGGKVISFIRKNDTFVAETIRLFNFQPIASNVSRNKQGLYFYHTISENNVMGYSAISNYALDRQ